MSDTRSKILDVAEDLVQRVGVNAMSYNDISEAVGIRKASIHHHFPKKENLVKELLERCHVAYGDIYKLIVEGEGDAPDKLRSLAGVFEEGLRKRKMCLVGSMSSDKNTLPEGSCNQLTRTIKETVATFSEVFRQGAEEGTLHFKGSNEELAYAYLSFLLGAQIIARSHGDTGGFQKATEAVIAGWEG